MSVQLRMKYKAILQVSTGTFGFWYDILMQLIKERKIDLTQNVQRVIDKLYLGNMGIGIDFIKYPLTKKDMAIFLSLVKEAIEMYAEKYRQYGEIEEERIRRFWSFYGSLRKFARKLPK